jgi:hypothetical protein
LANASLGRAVLSLETDSSKFEKGMDAAEGKTRAFGAAAAAAAGVLAGAVVGALSDAARAAADDAANVLKLKTAVENSGVSWEANRGVIERRIKAGQNLAFTDDQIRDSLSLLTAQTGDLGEALQRQKLAMDLSRGAGIDLQTASKLLGKVTDENVQVLGRYGINVAKGSDATALFAAVQQKFGGQAEAYGTTTAAAIFKVKDGIEEWKESIGAALGPTQMYIALLPGLSTGWLFVSGTLGPAVRDIWKAREAIVAKLAVLNPITLATKAWTIAQAALNLVMSANPIALVVIGLAALAVAIKFAYDHFEGFHKVVDGVLTFLRDVFAPILGLIGGAFEALGKLLGGESAKAADDVQFNFAEMQTGASSSMEQTRKNVAGSAVGMKDDVVTAFNLMKEKGVGAAQDMEIDSILAAAGMSDQVRAKAAEMVTGMAGLTEQQRDKTIFDMQYAKIETVLRARGLSDETVEAILSMVVRSREETEKMRQDHSNAIDRMIDRNSALAGSIADLPSYKQINIRTVYTSFGSPGGYRELEAQHGFHGIVSEPTLILAGERGAETVDIGPAAPLRSVRPRSAAPAEPARSGVTINVATLVVREEADVRRIARELDDLSRQRARQRGLPAPAAAW